MKTGIKWTLVVLQVVPARAEVPNSGDNELERSIKAAMMRMKKVAADSDEEDRGDDETQSADWDSWEHTHSHTYVPMKLFSYITLALFSSELQLTLLPKFHQKTSSLKGDIPASPDLNVAVEAVKQSFQNKSPEML